MAQQRVRVTKQVQKGPIHRVPCPYCGAKNDFRGLQGEAGWGDYGLERGAVVDCDHCGRKSQIVAVQTITVLTLRQHRR